MTHDHRSIQDNCYTSVDTGQYRWQRRRQVTPYYPNNGPRQCQRHDTEQHFAIQGDTRHLTKTHARCFQLPVLLLLTSTSGLQRRRSMPTDSCTVSDCRSPTTSEVFGGRTTTTLSPEVDWTRLNGGDSQLPVVRWWWRKKMTTAVTTAAERCRRRRTVRANSVGWRRVEDA